MRARVLLFASNLPDNLWAEAMHHGNWLRNRSPSDRIDGEILLLLWDRSMKVNFGQLLTFGEPGFAFIYRPRTVPNKKLTARSIHGHFIGMESDETLFRVYVPDTTSIIITRANDFKVLLLVQESQLFSMEYLASMLWNMLQDMMEVQKKLLSGLFLISHVHPQCHFHIQRNEAPLQHTFQRASLWHAQIQTREQL